MKEIDSFKYDITMQIGNLKEKIFSERIGILLRDKPKWLPSVIWRKLLKGMLTITIQETTK